MCFINFCIAFLQDARIVYICDGVQTVPGMSDKSLIDKYSQNVRQAVMYCAEVNPSAMVVIASNPVACFVPMAIEVYKNYLYSSCFT